MSYVIKSATLKGIADAIRAKTGKAGNILVSNFATEISSIPEAETEIFDGTIIIESGLTAISGEYLIDQEKAYDVLQSFIGIKTYTVAFGAGGPPNGGDEMLYTSMTFDGTNYSIKYNAITAFRNDNYMVEGDGFAGYTSAGGTGNGARVNFADGTTVRKEFKELFLSIADRLIAFTVDGKSYQAVEGMTWADWAESDYDVDGFMLAANVYHPNGTDYILDVTPYDVITDGGVYTTTSA